MLSYLSEATIRKLKSRVLTPPLLLLAVSEHMREKCNLCSNLCVRNVICVLNDIATGSHIKSSNNDVTDVPHLMISLMGVGKLGSMYGELDSISNMESDWDSNLRPNDHQARTLTTAPSCYPAN